MTIRENFDLRIVENLTSACHQTPTLGFLGQRNRAGTFKDPTPPPSRGGSLPPKSPVAPPPDSFLPGFVLDFRVSGSPASRSVKFPVCSSFVFRVSGVSASSCAVARCGRRGYSYCRACRNVRSGVKFPVAGPVASFGKSCEKGQGISPHPSPFARRWWIQASLSLSLSPCLSLSRIEVFNKLELSLCWCSAETAAAAT
ncbi:hypothetical protein NL676_031689 [Syzygium grande]|nr:hypothetical protein NL676_031689 [Syzygium grande]